MKKLCVGFEIKNLDLSLSDCPKKKKKMDQESGLVHFALSVKEPNPQIWEGSFDNVITDKLIQLKSTSSVTIYHDRRWMDTEYRLTRGVKKINLF